MKIGNSLSKKYTKLVENIVQHTYNEYRKNTEKYLKSINRENTRPIGTAKPQNI